MQVILFKVMRKHVFIWCKASLLFIFALSWPYFREMWRGCRCRDVRGVTEQDSPPSNRCFLVLCIIFQVSREPFSSKYDLFRQCCRTLVIEPAQNSSVDCSSIMGCHSYSTGWLLNISREYERETGFFQHFRFLLGDCLRNWK